MQMVELYMDNSLIAISLTDVPTQNQIFKGDPGYIFKYSAPHLELNFWMSSPLTEAL